MSWRVAASLVLWLVVCCSAWAETFTITTRADDVEMSYDKRHITLRGNAELTGQSLAEPSRHAEIRAELIEGDLTTGRFEALGDVHLATPEGMLRGESLVFNSQTSEFRLTRAGAVVGLSDDPRRPLCGYAYGREVTGGAHVIYINNGVFTTCNLAHPHYALEADRLVYDTESHQMAVEGGAVRLYGLRIPLLPKLKHSFGGESRGSPLLPQPTWTGLDGPSLLWPIDYSGAAAGVQARGGLLLTSRRGLRGWVDVGAPVANFAGHVRVSHKEDVRSDVSSWSLIDRMPEVELERQWGVDLFGGAQLSARLSAGDYRQYARGDAPEVRDRRALGAVRLGGGEAERRQGVGQWWWAEARTQRYDDADEYTVLEAGVGAGGELTDWLSGWVTYIHRDPRGQTPFEFDDVDIRRELAPHADVQLGENWALALDGRYDLDQERLRDWKVGLARDAHCLTWTLGYQRVSRSVGIGVEINGLTGRNSAPACPEDGPPDYWAAGRGSADEDVTDSTQTTLTE